MNKKLYATKNLIIIEIKKITFISWRTQMFFRNNKENFSNPRIFLYELYKGKREKPKEWRKIVDMHKTR